MRQIEETLFAGGFQSIDIRTNNSQITPSISRAKIYPLSMPGACDKSGEGKLSFCSNVDRSRSISALFWGRHRSAVLLFKSATSRSHSGCPRPHRGRPRPLPPCSRPCAQRRMRRLRKRRGLRYNVIGCINEIHGAPCMWRRDSPKRLQRPVHCQEIFR